jgi:F-type H+-transporting ATPase subunit b
MSIFVSITAATSMAAVEHAEEAAEHATSGVFPPLDVSTYPSQLFWLAVTFGLLMFLLAKVLLPRVGSILEDRSNRIADDLDNAARMQRDAERAEKAYDQALSDARAKAHNVSETTRASVSAEITSELEAAEAGFIEQMSVAEAKIRDMRTKALSSVEDIAAETAKNLVEKLGKASINLTTARKAVKAHS